MLLARTFKPREIRGAFWICSALLVAFFAVPYIAPVSAAYSLNALYEVACIAVVFPLIVWLGACGKSAGFTGRINRFLGQLSYPLYIVHYPLMYVFYKWLIDRKLYTWSDTWQEALLVMGGSLVLAYLCLRFYDIPVRRWLSSIKH
jgi:peptidoglycan/LPS O-acetylase OafA/YrhL